MPQDPILLDDYIASREQNYNLKPGTEAGILWQNKNKSPTKYSIVYLHGFKASHPEGNPVHKKIAKAFKSNLYLSRLEEHGYASGLPLINLTEEKLLKSACHAMEIGKRIGRKVILMGTSTGGSLALYLASKKEFKKDIAALVLYSPLIDFFDPFAKLLKSNLFRSLFDFIPGDKLKISKPELKTDEGYIWYDRYALRGALALGEFVNNHMHNDTFQRVNCPVFTGYYYRNKHYQDKVVSVNAIKRMHDILGTDSPNRTIMNFPNANTHVICSSILSDSVHEVISKTSEFISNHCHTVK